MNEVIYKIRSRSNGIYYSITPSTILGDESNLIIPLEMNSIEISSKEEFDNLPSFLTTYYPNGDPYDEWAYHEPKDICIVSGKISDITDEAGELVYIDGGEYRYDIAERIYNELTFSNGLAFDFPYTLCFINSYIEKPAAA